MINFFLDSRIRSQSLTFTFPHAWITILVQFELMPLLFTRITNLLLEFYTRKTHEYKRPVNTRACKSELVTSIGCPEFACAHKHARVGLRVKGLNMRVLIEVNEKKSYLLASWCTRASSWKRAVP